jgi:hypothetical protein
VNLAFAVMFLWAGGALLFVASRGLQATTPWGAYQSVVAKMREA